MKALRACWKAGTPPYAQPTRPPVKADLMMFTASSGYCCWSLRGHKPKSHCMRLGAAPAAPGTPQPRPRAPAPASPSAPASSPGSPSATPRRSPPPRGRPRPPHPGRHRSRSRSQPVSGGGAGRPKPPAMAAALRGGGSAPCPPGGARRGPEAAGGEPGGLPASRLLHTSPRPAGGGKVSVSISQDLQW